MRDTPLREPHRTLGTWRVKEDVGLFGGPVARTTLTSDLGSRGSSQSAKWTRAAEMASRSKSILLLGG